ncbi:hypothetical protein H0O00_01640 [Candidatus Micrarchaeota archaeon]|nr:hypothetical protein [Candidatus Micrarchaeota archaeon]
MKETEVKLDEEGFEEIESSGKSPEQPAQSGSGNRPDFRIVQTDRDKNGNVVYANVGGMWRNISKNGNEFYTLRIGQLKLLVFPNDRK